MRIILVLLLTLYLQQRGHADEKQLSHSPPVQPKPSTPDPLNHSTADHPSHSTADDPSHSTAERPNQTPQPTRDPAWLVDKECLKQKHTHMSCTKVFCPPWKRCISGKCVCKVPFQCLRLNRPVCGLDNRSYISYCQAQAVSCRTKKPVFSHYGENCEDVFTASLQTSGDHEVVQVITSKGKALICAELWDMAAANVVCHHIKENDRGAAAAQKIKVKDLKVHKWPKRCMRVSCTGTEFSLAECTMHDPQRVQDNTEIAAVTCYQKGSTVEECSEFSCVNGKCISWTKTCDGVNDCGDNSDEMCCKGCRGDGFYCKSGVCISGHAKLDGIRDCLGGEDELHKPTDEPAQAKSAWSNPKDDIKLARSSTEMQLECGIPNLDYVYRTGSDQRSRRMRFVGGQETLPTQIQWQVGIEENQLIDCSGVYLGGCWVLTAAHCVRPKPQAFRIRFSLWNKLASQNTTDSVPVKNIIIHEKYDPRTYRNDIALVQLDEFIHNDKKICLHPNPAVRSVCVPWSPEQFQHGDTCTISGWGRNKEGATSYSLKWANVTIIRNCSEYYKERFLDGMECAGDIEGKVDSCQGDSGGPLVCKDASGLSYVWGIVSWGEKCGEANYPGVYTKVADYFEWIRFNTGSAAVTKFNQ